MREQENLTTGFSMRLAILADIHGNLPAFEAALEHVAGRGVDLIILAGDIINGSPDSAACWQLAKSLACPMLRGNHERYAFDYGTPAASPAWSTELFAPLQWSIDQLSGQDRLDMARLPSLLRIPAAPDLLIVHASERSDSETIEAFTPEENLGGMFPHSEERYIIRAHNHISQVRLWGSRFILTAGSVGLPLNGSPSAQYLLLDQHKYGWHIQPQSVPYDLDLVLQRFYDTGYLSKTGPCGRLYFREVLTASHQLVPFLRLYAQWSKKGNLSLSDALERFLHGC
jgi:predicted phosphodiesterase